jgi:hypothetical protein
MMAGARNYNTFFKRVDRRSGLPFSWQQAKNNNDNNNNNNNKPTTKNRSNYREQTNPSIISMPFV